MNPYMVGFFVGSVFACFIVSRLFHWLGRKLLLHQEERNLVVFIATATTASLISWGSSDSVDNWLMYMAASALVFCFDTFRLGKTKQADTQVGNPDTNPTQQIISHNPPEDNRHSGHQMKLPAASGGVASPLSMHPSQAESTLLVSGEVIEFSSNITCVVMRCRLTAREEISEPVINLDLMIVQRSENKWRPVWHLELYARAITDNTISNIILLNGSQIIGEYVKINDGDSCEYHRTQHLLSPYQVCQLARRKNVAIPIGFKEPDEQEQTRYVEYRKNVQKHIALFQEVFEFSKGMRRPFLSTVASYEIADAHHLLAMLIETLKPSKYMDLKTIATSVNSETNDIFRRSLTQLNKEWLLAYAYAEPKEDDYYPGFMECWFQSLISRKLNFRKAYKTTSFLIDADDLEMLSRPYPLSELCGKISVTLVGKLDRRCWLYEIWHETDMSWKFLIDVGWVYPRSKP
ncbi:MAG: hypothetical protein HY537_08200 [Deltaproteobacteria bacterium]|nr:hypothetical protein [Deltaproteobacteria bacterium]